MQTLMATAVVVLTYLLVIVMITEVPRDESRMTRAARTRPRIEYVPRTEN